MTAQVHAHAAATRAAFQTPASPSGDSAATRHSPAVRPQQRDQFESALRRHRQEDEATEQGDNAVLPWGQPLAPTPSLTTPTPAQRELATGASPAGALPRTAAAQDAVSSHLRALGTAPLGATQAHWQVQWAGATAPVQQVDLRRTDSGALHLDMSGSVHASDPARLARLRDRVAARAGVSEVVVLAHPPGAGGHAGHSHRSGHRHPDDEGNP